VGRDCTARRLGCKPMKLRATLPPLLSARPMRCNLGDPHAVAWLSRCPVVPSHVLYTYTIARTHAHNSCVHTRDRKRRCTGFAFHFLNR
jgi:hypothetical protein